MPAIEIEGLGTMRLCNPWQANRIHQMRPGRNRALAPAAFGLGMTVRQFKKLPTEQQRAACEAYFRLTDPRGKPEGLRNFARGSA